MSGLWVSIILTSVSELPKDAVGLIDLSPKSGLMFASKEACEASNVKLREFSANSKSVYQYPDGRQVEIKAKNDYVCFPVYMDPDEFEKAFGAMSPKKR